MSSKNLIASMANDIYDQWQKCKTAKGNDFDRESHRLDDACKGGQAISALANVQLKQLVLTGFLPDENILVDANEVKLINAKRNLASSNKQNFLDEFQR